MFGQDDNQNNVGQTNGSVPGMADPIVSPSVPEQSQSASVPSFTPPTDSSSDVESQATAPPVPVTDAPSDELLNLKQEALQQLSPLVGHLDQNPEEKFRTTMMMIQAADDQTLIKAAYEAAKQITDEKARAQALLDVINEINYFTQQHTSN